LVVTAACGPSSFRTAPPAAPEVTAAVRIVRPSLESIPYRVVTLGFVNRSSRTVMVDAYRIAWPGGDFTASDVGVRLAPGAAVSRTARIGLDRGGLDNLTEKTAAVTLLDVRDAP
jgi:hypothetical protein